MDTHQFHTLFPHPDQQRHERLFQSIHHQTKSDDEDGLEADAGGYEEEAIDEDLLKKTSQLHQALRNIKLLRFQLVQSRIMKRTNLSKCRQHELAISTAIERKAVLEEDNEQLDREIQIYSQRVRQQKQANRLSYEKLRVAEEALNKARIHQRQAMETSNLLEDKENISILSNHRYISLDKLSLEAHNKGSEEMITLIKQDIQAIKQRFSEAEGRKLQLQSQYTTLLEQLKAKQRTSKKK